MLMCQYCNIRAKRVTGERVYPHRPDLYYLKFYCCTQCNAYVGVHKKSGKPLGTLANNTLRDARRKAHVAFDPLWQDKKSSMTRREAYTWLADTLGIAFKDCHIALFDLTTCGHVVNLATNKIIEKGVPEFNDFMAAT